MLSSEFLLLLPSFINLVQERTWCGMVCLCSWKLPMPLVPIEAALLLTMPCGLRSVACTLEKNLSLLLLGRVFLHLYQADWFTILFILFKFLPDDDDNDDDYYYLLKVEA